MNALIIVGLITYASILRPILDDRRVDPHNMWVWQLFTITIIVVPRWIPFWSELALLLCFVIGCLDARVMSHNVRSLVFPEIRRRLSFLMGPLDDATSPDPAPVDVPIDPATPSSGDSSTVVVESET